MQAPEKAMALIAFAKEQSPPWKGKGKLDDPEPGWMHVTASRVHPEYGNEQVELWWHGNAMKRPPEYTRNGVTVIEKNSAEIRRRLAGEDTIATKTAFDAPAREPRRRNGADVARPDAPIRKSLKPIRLPFGPDSDDDTILDNLIGRRVIVNSTIGDYLPPVEHRVEFDRRNKPKVVRFPDGRVNVDYNTDLGFRSLRVNNIVRVR